MVLFAKVPQKTSTIFDKLIRLLGGIKCQKYLREEEIFVCSHLKSQMSLCHLLCALTFSVSLCVKRATDIDSHHLCLPPFALSLWRARTLHFRCDLCTTTEIQTSVAVAAVVVAAATVPSIQYILYRKTIRKHCLPREVCASVVSVVF